MLYSSDPFDPASLPNLGARGDLLSNVSVANLALPPSAQSASTQMSVRNLAMVPGGTPGAATTVVSVENVDTNTIAPDALRAGLSRSEGAANPAVGADVGSGVRLELSVGAQRLIEGQTLEVRATTTGFDDTTAMTFTINGAEWQTDSSPPFVTTFTVPAGVTELAFGGSLRRAAGEDIPAAPVTVGVDPDPLTTVIGRVIDGNGNPMVGAIVELVSNGLTAEYFDFGAPLTRLPDVGRAIPNRVTRITAINARLGRLFGVDPFGTGMAPDYSARFSGQFLAPTAGDYTFFLGADEGARLRVGGRTVIDMPTPAASGYQERSRTVRLRARPVPIEILSYQSAGSTELQLSVEAAGGSRQVLAPAAFLTSGDTFRAVADSSGRFEIRNVPIVVSGTALRVNARRTTTNIAIPGILVAPVVDVGDVVVRGGG